MEIMFMEDTPVWCDWNEGLNHTWCHSSSLSLQSDTSKDETLYFRERSSSLWSEEEDVCGIDDVGADDDCFQSSDGHQVPPKHTAFPGFKCVSVKSESAKGNLKRLRHFLKIRSSQSFRGRQ